MRVAFLLFDQMDLMDFAGPFEVLLTANRLQERDGLPQPFELITVSPDGEPVYAYGGVALVPQSEPTTPVDVVVVPGTIDVAAALVNDALITSVATLSDRADVTTSVCTGAFLLAAVDALVGREWTTHWEDLPELSARLAGGRRARVVDTGDVVTSGGIGCGIDLGLHLVSRFVDPSLAQRCARQMDVVWQDPASVT